MAVKGLKTHRNKEVLQIAKFRFKSDPDKDLLGLTLRFTLRNWEKERKCSKVGKSPKICCKINCNFHSVKS